MQPEVAEVPHLDKGECRPASAPCGCTPVHRFVRLARGSRHHTRSWRCSRSTGGTHRYILSYRGQDWTAWDSWPLQEYI